MWKTGFIRSSSAGRRSDPTLTSHPPPAAAGCAAKRLGGAGGPSEEEVTHVGSGSRRKSRHMLSLCGRPSRFTGQYGRRAHLTQKNHLTAAVAQSSGISTRVLCWAIFRRRSATQKRCGKQTNLSVAVPGREAEFTSTERLGLQDVVQLSPRLSGLAL